MALKHRKAPTERAGDLAVAPLFTLETTTIPRHELPEGEIAPEVAYQIIHDELMLDGNARMNVAVPLEGDRFNLSAEEAVKPCDENTIGVVSILGSTFDGSYEPVQEICDALDVFENQTGIDVPVHVDGASGAMIAPFVDPDLKWDFQLPRVASINTSGHECGLVYPGVGWIVWRDADALPEDLIVWVDYLGDNRPTLARTRFRRTGPTSRRFVSSSGGTSATTWPTCSFTT